jgi:VanZ family protein
MQTTMKVSSVININSDNFYILRKSGHFIEFFILEVLILGVISSFNKIDFKGFILSIIFCLIYASSDEIHQLFVIGRSARVMDVCIDLCGSIFGGLLFFAIYYVNKGAFIDKNI